MADALLLASTRVEPGVLTKAGYRYRFTDLTQTLRYLLGCERLDSIQ
jgi:NAD dependent epimerase/dehydratase family enzyme